MLFPTMRLYGNCTAGSSPGASRKSAVIFPNPAKIQQLMSDYGHWRAAASPGPETAFKAHFRLVAIHPFSDGNGRTARLLMNLLLIRTGYPPIAIRPEDRKTYLDALEHASMRDDTEPFDAFLYQRLNATLDEYLTVLQEEGPAE